MSIIKARDATPGKTYQVVSHELIGGMYGPQVKLWLGGGDFAYVGVNTPVGKGLTNGTLHEPLVIQTEEYILRGEKHTGWKPVGFTAYGWLSLPT